VTVEDLYGVPPEDFLARRKELVAAVKKRGDAEAAALIATARRPTTAAWVVNALVRADDTATARLRELSEALHQAHAVMDGARIRELSTAQRKLVDELARTGFAATSQSSPSAALRDDVVGTLQAAIADPDVAARLGRLEKAERWSGFGDFGAVTPVGPVPKRKAERKPASKPTTGRTEDDAELAAARERVATARTAAEVARQAHTDALELAAEREAKLAQARRRYEELLALVDAAEKALNAADDQFSAAERAMHAAADRRDSAIAEVTRAESEVERLQR
jgi:hypothetical protein